LKAQEGSQARPVQWASEGVLNGDKKSLVEALYRDPLCAHLKPHEVRNMAEELLAANRGFFSLG
jgi:alpha-galactosidase/6-phospho-beta-glucosidase family protein